MRLENVRAPAKLNLFLHVTGRRDDGYHLLQSAFVRIDWFDVLGFERRQADPTITREDLTAVLPPVDLCIKAAQALQAASGTPHGAHIRIAKHIPAEAGLGGGSSDAAATLLALNRLWELNWPRQRLQALAASLGADVPFFVAGTHAWVEGVGERLTPLTGTHALPPLRFVVVKPPGGASTAKIFTHPLLKRDTPCATISRFAAEPVSFGRNDLQAAAEQVCPDVGNAIGWLESHGFQARMTGSGSAAFAVIASDDPGLRLQNLLADVPVGWTVKVCNMLDNDTA